MHILVDRVHVLDIYRQYDAVVLLYLFLRRLCMNKTCEMTKRARLLKLVSRAFVSQSKASDTGPSSILSVIKNSW